ncbi:hypothetical protein ACET3Z_025460 [Daucus carota]
MVDLNVVVGEGVCKGCAAPCYPRHSARVDPKIRRLDCRGIQASSMVRSCGEGDLSANQQEAAQFSSEAEFLHRAATMNTKIGSLRVSPASLPDFQYFQSTTTSSFHLRSR